MLSFGQLLAEHEGVFDYFPEPDDLCTIMFTSGTTGKSKGVMLTQRNMAENATCFDMKIPDRTVLLSVLPIHHAYCLSMDILKGISLGAVICINDSLMRVAKNIKLFKPELMLMVPADDRGYGKKTGRCFRTSGKTCEKYGLRQTVSYHLQRRSLLKPGLYRFI